MTEVPDAIANIYSWIDGIQTQVTEQQTNPMLFGQTDAAGLRKTLMAWAEDPCWMDALRSRLVSGQLPIEDIAARLDKACARNTGLLWGFIDLVWTSTPLEFDIRTLPYWELFLKWGLFARPFSAVPLHDSSVERYMRHWSFACDQGIRVYGFTALKPTAMRLWSGIRHRELW